MRTSITISGIVLAASSALATVDGFCATATPKQLTWSCGSVCGEYIPCLAFDASDCDSANCAVDADNECAYQCFTKFYSSGYTGELLIPYGSSYQSEEEVADRQAMGDEAYDAQFDSFDDETDSYAWTSNDDLNSIATVEMDPNVFGMFLYGGSSNFSSDAVRGKVADVTLEEPFVAESDLHWVQVRNLNLKDVNDLSLLLPSSLIDLDLQNNLIYDLPFEASSFPALKYLDLRSNYLTTFSGSFPNLTSLDLANNELTSFDGSFPALEHLYLSWNELTSLNGSLPALESLYLSGNNFTTFSGTFSELTDLHLYNNKLTSFDGSFPALETLDLGSNLLTTFSGTFSELTDLDLGSNALTSFDGSYPAIQTLDLSYNHLTAIPDVAFKMPSLQELRLRGNSFSGMPAFTRAQVTFLQNLTELGLSAEDFTEEADCDLAREATVASITVCVIDDVTAEATDDTSGSPAVATDDTSGSTAETADDPSTSPSATAPATSGLNGTVITVIVSFVVVLIVIAVAVSWARGQRHSKDTASVPAEPRSDAPLWSDTLLQSLQLDVRDLEDIRQLGSGSFGTVWLVRYRGNQLLASKRLHASGRGVIGMMHHQEATARFVEEIKLASQLDHPNIATLVGVAWTFHSDIQALFEFMENGDLRDFLVKTHPSKDSTKKSGDPRARLTDELLKLQIACDIADALVYVHSFVPAIVHRDIKSRNVLLSSEWRAKLTDFGTARLQSVDHTMTAEVGTGRWLSPEVLAGRQDYGSPSDVFAFGVVLSELDTHAIPYDDARSNDGKKPLANVAIMQLVADGKLRPTFSAQCRPELRALADRCLAQNSEDRPVAAVLSYELRKVMKLVQLEGGQGGSRFAI